jgi:magnesium-transporting ATPase (P-type)
MEQSAASAPAAPMLTPWQRMIAVFTRPRAAMAGLAERPTSLLPMILFLLVVLAQMLLIYQSSIVPMQLEQMEKKVDAGQMAPEALDHMESMMRSPVGEAWGVGLAVIVVALINLLIAALVLVAMNFVLGGRMSFRQSWSLNWWTSLISVAGIVVSTVLTLATGKFPVHLGLGVLAPPEQATSKLGVFVGTLLDAISPFTLWWLAVLVIGASAISGKPTRAIAWTFAAFFLVFSVIGAGLGALATPVG